jgi:biopolymer transport protein ExbD
VSHGSSSDKCEPNLVPLLDMVLQLVMFFMVCANFVMEQVNDTIKLPEAIAAKPVTARDPDTIFLNVNKQGKVLLSGLQRAANNDRDPENPEQLKNFMKRMYDEDVRGSPDKKPRMTIILRVDRETQWEHTYALMKAIRQSGYQQVKLRAIRFGGVTGS